METEAKWLVVNFLEDNTIEVIPHNWLHSNGRSFFPPRGTTPPEYTKLVKKSVTPHEDWNLYSIKVLGAYETVKIAYKKAKKALDSDKLSSVDEEMHQGTKRKRKRNKKYHNTTDDGSSSSGEYSSESTDSDDLPTPPKNVKKQQTIRKALDKKIIENTQIPGSERSHRCEGSATAFIISNDSPNRPIKHTSVLKETNTTCVNHYKPPGGPSLSLASTVTLQSEESPSTSTRYSTPTMMETEVLDREDSTFQFQKQIIRNLFIIRSILETHTENFNKLFKTSLPQVELDFDNEELQATLKLLPISSEENLETLETFLSNTANFKAFARELSRLGGDSTESMVKKFLYKVINNDLGSKFSYEGAIGKKIFKKLNLSKVLLHAVRLNKNLELNGDETTVIKYIKKWLARAKERAENQQKKINPN